MAHIDNNRVQDQTKMNIPTKVLADESTSNTAHQGKMKFKTIAKGLSIMSRVRVADSNMLRDQVAFFNKYGISTSDAMGESVSDEQSGIRDRLWNFNGMSKWDFLRSKFVLDPSKDYYYHWLGVVAIAYFYNLLFIVFRTVFIDKNAVGTVWIITFIFFDILADIIYGLDCFVRSRTGYLEQGLVVKDVRKVKKAYWKSYGRNIDILSCLPLDYLSQVVLQTTNPMFRINRLIRLDRATKFINTTEMRVSKPNAFRILCVVIYILVLIHWNACLYFIISYWIGLGSDGWVYGVLNKQSLPDGINDTLSRRYCYCFYWSTLLLTTLGEVPWPVTNIEMIFVCIDCMCGVLIVATIVGNVGSMIANMDAARTSFQNTIDVIKQFMKLRGIGRVLINRVLKWFEVSWENKQMSEQEVLKVLPTKLQAEIAMHVHFETLRKVRIFQDCEAGLLAELVLKLQPQVFSPNDFICRKGDVGREMYIVKKGRLQVVSEDGAKVFHTLQEGAVFGELSILNIPGNRQGNKRSASIRSVGYTDLFVLNKTDLWDALREYPEAKKVLIQKGREMLQKDNLLDESAQLETTTDEASELVKERIDKLQHRLARLLAEHLSMEAKLKARVENLERELEKYESLSDTEEEV